MTKKTLKLLFLELLGFYYTYNKIVTDHCMDMEDEWEKTIIGGVIQSNRTQNNYF